MTNPVTAIQNLPPDSSQSARAIRNSAAACAQTIDVKSPKSIEPVRSPTGTKELTRPRDSRSLSAERVQHGREPLRRRIDQRKEQLDGVFPVPSLIPWPGCLVSAIQPRFGRMAAQRTSTSHP